MKMTTNVEKLNQKLQSLLDVEFCKILTQPLKLLIICSIQPKLIVTFVMEGF